MIVNCLLKAYFKLAHYVKLLGAKQHCRSKRQGCNALTAFKMMSF